MLTSSRQVCFTVRPMWPEITAAFKSFHEVAHPYLESFSILLGAVALAYAAKQKRDAHQQKRDATQLKEESKTVLEGLREIVDSLSTRYVGLFPDNMSEIVEVINRSERELRIMCDIAAYGHYSRPKTFLEYLQNLERKSMSEKVKVRIIAYDKPTGRRGHQSQFDGEQGFPSEKANERFRYYFNDVHPELQKPDSYHDFDELMMNQEEMYEKRLRTFCHLASANEPLRVFLWLADEKEAVFCFENAGKRGTREISFRTRDVALIKTFTDLFEQHWDTFTKRSAQATAMPTAAIASANSSRGSQT